MEDASVHQWYRSINGALLHRPPERLALDLAGQGLEGLAGRRFLVWFGLPILGLAIIVAFLSCISAVVTVERWCEAADAPGVRLDVDQWRWSVSAFDAWDHLQQPLLPHAPWHGRQYLSQMGPPEFYFNWRWPERESLLAPGLFVFLALVGRWSAWLVLTTVMAKAAGTSEWRTWRRAWLGLAWFGPPFALAMLFQVVVLVCTALGDLEIARETQSKIGLAAWLVSVGVYLAGGWRVWRQVSMLNRQTGEAVEIWQRFMLWGLGEASILAAIWAALIAVTLGLYELGVVH